MANFFAELKRRHIYRVAAAYAVVAWLVIQLVNNIAPLLKVPDWIGSAVLVVLMVGLPLALLFAWVLDLKGYDASATTRTGTADWAFAGVAAAIIALLVYQQFAPSRATGTAQSGTEAAREAAAKPAGISVAVLPFTNLSGDPAQEFFSDGMTEEITTALAKIPDLRVVARTSAFQFKAQNRDIQSIGQQLHASHFIEGSVRKEGDRVRITAQLIKADDGTHVWAENYDRQLTGIFAIQEDIAQAIAGALRMPLGLKPGETLVNNRSIDPESYQQFLRARALGGGTRGQRAIPLLESLVARNPDYAPAWARLAWLYALTPNFSRNRPLEELRRVMKESVANADAAGRRAIQLDPNLADGYAALGRLQIGQGKLLAAEESYSKALALDPNSPDALERYGDLLAVVGRLKEAIAIYDQVRILEPTVSFAPQIAQLLWVTGQNDSAIALLKDFGSDNQPDAIDLANIYASMGRYKEAADLLQGMTLQNLPAEMLAAGVRLLRSAPSKTAAPQSLPRLGYLGFIYLYVGAPLRALERFEEWGEAGYYVTGGADNAFLWHPSYAAVRKSERFKTFMRKAGYVEYWRAKGWPEFCHPTTSDDFECK